jgi:hypothetical protein
MQHFIDKACSSSTRREPRHSREVEEEEEQEQEQEKEEEKEEVEKEEEKCWQAGWEMEGEREVFALGRLFQERRPA